MAEADAGPVQAIAGGISLQLRVIPRSPKNVIGGVRDGRLLIRVTAPPVDQAANEAVIRLLAENLKIPKSRVSVTAGATGRNKTVGVAGLSAAEARERLGLTPPG